MKVIAAVDIMGGNVVRLVKGDPTNKIVYGSDPVETAKKWESAGADMLHVVDLDATLSTGSNSE
jgi:phosphoribosylformimino-5-aminoimidazole carboxamide ribotide isomerase